MREGGWTEEKYDVRKEELKEKWRKEGSQEGEREKELSATPTCVELLQIALKQKVSCLSEAGFSLSHMAAFYNPINITADTSNAVWGSYSSSEAQCDVALLSRVHNLHLEVVAPGAERLASLSEPHIHDALSLSYVLQQLWRHTHQHGYSLPHTKCGRTAQPLRNATDSHSLWHNITLIWMCTIRDAIYPRSV